MAYLQQLAIDEEKMRQMSQAQGQPNAMRQYSGPFIGQYNPAQGGYSPSRNNKKPSAFGDSKDKGGSTGGGGSFVGFSQYLNANRESANQMADKVAEGVTKGFDAARDAVENAYTGFRGDVQKGMVNYTGAVPSTDIRPAVAREPGTQPAPPQPQQPPVDYANAQYTGPNDIRQYEPFGRAMGLVDDANEQLGLLDEVGMDSGFGVEAGLETLLDQYGDANVFDAALTSAVGQPRFDALRQEYAGFGDYIDDVAREGDVIVDAARQTTDDSRERYRTDRDAYQQRLRDDAQRDSDFWQQASGNKLQKRPSYEEYQTYFTTRHAPNDHQFMLSPEDFENMSDEDLAKHMRISTFRKVNMEGG